MVAAHRVIRVGQIDQLGPQPLCGVGEGGKVAGLKLNGVDDYGLGFNVGAGLEVKVAPNWSVYGEYRFNRLWVDTVIGNKSVNVHDAKIGVNYRFGAPAPVVAKY